MVGWGEGGSGTGNAEPARLSPSPNRISVINIVTNQGTRTRECPKGLKPQAPADPFLVPRSAEPRYARQRDIGIGICVWIWIMSGPKAALKAIGAAIKSQKYDDAVQEAQKLLATDPKSHQAYVSYKPFALNVISALLVKLTNSVKLSLPRIRSRQAEQECRGRKGVRVRHEAQGLRSAGMAGTHTTV